MQMDHGDRIGRDGRTSRFDDSGTDRWRIRMAWSMLAAGAAHGALFALWPAFERSAVLLAFPIEATEPAWIEPYQGASGGDEQGDPITIPGPIATAPQDEGMVTAPDPVNPILVEGSGTSPTPADAEGAVLSEALQGLVRRTTMGPTLAGLEFQSFGEDQELLEGLDEMGFGRTPTAADPTAVDYPSVEEATALDLSRLAGFDPEVALEASTTWVLIRNPREVELFMGRNSINSMSRNTRVGADGTVAVAMWIDARGSVEWAEIIQSSGRGDIDELALSLFNDVVRFRPARLAGVLMPMSAIFSVTFSSD